MSGEVNGSRDDESDHHERDDDRAIVRPHRARPLCKRHTIGGTFTLNLQLNLTVGRLGIALGVRFGIGIRAVNTLSRSRMSCCYLFDTAANAAGFGS